MLEKVVLKSNYAYAKNNVKNYFERNYEKPGYSMETTFLQF